MRSPALFLLGLLLAACGTSRPAEQPINGFTKYFVPFHTRHPSQDYDVLDYMDMIHTESVYRFRTDITKEDSITPTCGYTADNIILMMWVMKEMSWVDIHFYEDFIYVTHRDTPTSRLPPGRRHDVDTMLKHFRKLTDTNANPRIEDRP